MVDFIKVQILNFPPEKLEINPLLEFHSSFNETTGEISYKKKAKYKGLTFKIYQPNENNTEPRITMSGSLHKFKNQGVHNFDRFSIDDLKETLNEIKGLFGIFPEQCKIKTIEVGLNIKAPISVKNIISQCFLHKTEEFKSIQTYNLSNFIVAEHTRYAVKIYDKSLQMNSLRYTCPTPIMRFEIKFKRMYDLNKNNIYFLNDFINKGLGYCKERLIKEWNNILLVDNAIKLPPEMNKSLLNPLFWANEKVNNYNRFRYYRYKLKHYYQSKPNNLHRQIENKLNEELAAI